VLYLGQCDHFAIQHGYQEFVVKRPADGILADLWTATPVLTETAELVELLEDTPRVWFVSDSWRFQTRYSADFVQTVMDHMDLEYNKQGVLIFRSDGYEPLLQPAIYKERRADFDEALALVGVGLSSANPMPGDELEVTLNWQALDAAEPAYTAFLHLLRADGTGAAGVDESVLRGLYQPDFWPQGMTFADPHHLALPSDLPPGRYRLDLGLYPSGQPEASLPVEGGDRLPLASLTIGDVAAPPPPSSSTGIDFDGLIRLVGYDLEWIADGDLQIKLHWQATGSIERDYTVFVHLVGPDGTIVTQHDAPPGDPFFPTSTWLPGETVVDPHLLSLPAETLPGNYSLLVGLYHQPSNERLPAVDDNGVPLGDTVPLTTLAVGETAP
jgi:hypothetical protein